MRACARQGGRSYLEVKVSTSAAINPIAITYGTDTSRAFFRRGSFTELLLFTQAVCPCPSFTQRKSIRRAMLSEGLCSSKDCCRKGYAV